MSARVTPTKGDLVSVVEADVCPSSYVVPHPAPQCKTLLTSDFIHLAFKERISGQ